MKTTLSAPSTKSSLRCCHENRFKIILLRRPGAAPPLFRPTRFPSQGRRGSGGSRPGRAASSSKTLDAAPGARFTASPSGTLPDSWPESAVGSSPIRTSLSRCFSRYRRKRSGGDGIQTRGKRFISSESSRRKEHVCASLPTVGGRQTRNTLSPVARPSSQSPCALY